VNRRRFALLLTIVLVAEAALVWLITELWHRTVTGKAPAESSQPSTSVEFAIGDFVVTNSTFPGARARVEMTVFVEVPAPRRNDFTARFSARQGRIRDTVATTIRHCDFLLLEEPELATLKRMIKRAITENLGSDESLIEGVIVTDFVLE
jgi:flagellar basal body-associated protein FliL